MPFDLEIDQPKLLAAVSAASSIADKRSANMPILANVLLVADKHGITASASDMSISLRVQLDGTAKANGMVSLSASAMLGLVKTLPNKPLRLTGLDNHWVSLRTGRSEFKMMGVNGVDFPELPEARKATWTKFPSSILRELFDKTLFSVSTDEARVNLNGPLLESDGRRATMVSTDGHRLTKLSIDATLPQLDSGVVIPRRGVLEARKFIERHGGEMEMAIESGHLFLKTGTALLSIKLNNVVFPPYEQVIPREHKRRVIALRDELINVLRRCEVMAPNKTATVKLDLAPNTIVVTADNPDLGIAREELEVQYKGEPLEAGFNARYFLDLLEVMSTKEVTLEFNGALDPCVLRPVDGPDYLGVVMPMRI